MNSNKKDIYIDFGQFIFFYLFFCCFYFSHLAWYYMCWYAVHYHSMVQPYNHYVIVYYLDVFVYHFLCRQVKICIFFYYHFQLIQSLFFQFYLDCESLIRKMLVLDPNRRYTIPQIKQHRWMLTEIVDSVAFLSEKNSTFGRSPYAEPNEQVLRLMSGLGIDMQRTRNSLKVRKWGCYRVDQ